MINVVTRDPRTCEKECESAELNKESPAGESTFSLCDSWLMKRCSVRPVSSSGPVLGLCSVSWGALQLPPAAGLSLGAAPFPVASLFSEATSSSEPRKK